jgi:signal peptidase I
MNTVITLCQEVWKDYPHFVLMAAVLMLIGFMAKMKLFSKADQPLIAALVPFWDLQILLRMVGRPKHHIWYFFVPVLNVFFVFKLMIELAQSFGKTTYTDAFLVVVFNLLYILNLALSYNEEYQGPVYRIPEEMLAQRNKHSLA